MNYLDGKHHITFFRNVGRMKVKDLIKHLSELDQNKDITILSLKSGKESVAFAIELVSKTEIDCWGEGSDWLEYYRIICE